MRFWPRRKAVEDAREEPAGDYSDAHTTYWGFDPANPSNATVFGFTLPGSTVTLTVEGECGVSQLNAMIALLGSYRSQLEASAKAQAEAAAKVDVPAKPLASNAVLPSERAPRWQSKGNGNYPKSPVRNLPG